MTTEPVITPETREAIERICADLTKWLDDEGAMSSQERRGRAVRMVRESVEQANELDKERRIELACEMMGYDQSTMAETYGASGVADAHFKVHAWSPLTIVADIELARPIEEVKVTFTLNHGD